MVEKEHVSRFNVRDADVDQLRDHYADTLKPVKVNPLSGSKSISVEDLHFSIGDFDIWAGNCPSGMEVSFSEPPDLYAMYLPLAGALQFELHGMEVLSLPGKILTADLEQLKAMRFHPDRSHIGIGFSKNALTQQLSEMIDAPVTQSLDLVPVLETVSGVGNKLAAMCRLLWTDLAINSEGNPASHSNEMFVRTIMVTLLENVPHRYSAKLDRRPPSAIPRQLKRAIDYINAHVGSPLSTEDIARAAGVSARALQTAFQQFKGVAPMAYIRELRLAGVRNELKSADASILVSDIARRWGFQHMGRFAAMYTQAFGERPSETIDRADR